MFFLFYLCLSRVPNDSKFGIFRCTHKEKEGMTMTMTLRWHLNIKKKVGQITLVYVAKKTHTHLLLSRAETDQPGTSH